MRDKFKLILAMLIFGSIGLFVRYLKLPSSTIALIRGLIGTIILFSYQHIKGDKFNKKSLKNNYKILILSGTALGLNWILLFEAYRYTTISIATLCYYFAPVIVILLSPVVFKEKVGAKQAIGVLLSIVGMVFVAGVFDEKSIGTGNIKGILLGLAAAILYASIMFFNKFLGDVNEIDSTITQLGVATIVLLPYVIITGNISKIFDHPDLRSITILLLVGVIHTGIAYLLYFSSITHLQGQTIALFSYIDPVTAIILSTCILKENMSVLQVLGAILILGTTLCNELSKKSSLIIKNEQVN